MARGTLLALCVLAAGLRVQSMPVTSPESVSLPSKISAPTVIWPNSSGSPPASPTKRSTSNPILPVTHSAQKPPVFKNASKELREEETTSTVLSQKVTETNPSPTRSEVHLTPTSSMEHSSTPPTASVPATEPPSPTNKSLTITSPQIQGSSPSSLSKVSPEVTSTSVSSNHSSSTQASTKPKEAPATSEAPVTSKAPTISKAPTTSKPLTTSKVPEEEHDSGHTPSSYATTEPVPTETVPQTTAQPTQSTAQTVQTTLSVIVTCGKVGVEVTNTSPGVIMQEVEHALSAGSIAAITVTVIAVVLLVFGVAAYLKIRHSSYGRLLDDHDYGSWGNYNNPLYDDS